MRITCRLPCIKYLRSLLLSFRWAPWSGHLDRFDAHAFFFSFCLGRYCGSELPHPVTSFSNSLLVNFVSDPSISYRGFRATYSASTSSETHVSVLLRVHLMFTVNPFAVLIQAVEEIWWWRMVRSTAQTIQIRIHPMWNVFGPSEAPQAIVSSYHLCQSLSSLTVLRCLKDAW